MLRTEQDETQGRVSILIPLYNHAAYVEQCLDSILEQGLENVELLLLDDGSKDNGFQVACDWKARNGHHFKKIDFQRQENAGITRTFDRLITKSTGDFILIVASDDALLPSSIAQRLLVMKDDSVMGVFGDAQPIDEAGKSLGCSAIGELGNPANRQALSDPRTVHWEMIFRWNVYGSVLMLRRSAIVMPDGKSRLNLEIYSEDMQLYYMLGSQGTLRYLDKPVSLYRVHAASASHSIENLAKLRANVYHSRLNALAGMPCLPAAVVRLQSWTYYRWNRSGAALFMLPVVVVAYTGIWLARTFYDFYRRTFLGQGKNA